MTLPEELAAFQKWMLEVEHEVFVKKKSRIPEKPKPIEFIEVIPWNRKIWNTTRENRSSLFIHPHLSPEEVVRLTKSSIVDYMRDENLHSKVFPSHPFDILDFVIESFSDKIKPYTNYITKTKRLSIGRDESIIEMAYEYHHSGYGPDEDTPRMYSIQPISHDEAERIRSGE
jgi:hypothetical protein